MTDSTPLPWRRFWYERGAVPHFRQGYLNPPRKETTDDILSRLMDEGLSNVVPFEKIAPIPFLVLLGDVGLGKSTVLKAEAEALQQQLAGNPAHRCLWVDLKGRSEGTIEKALFQSGAFKAWAAGECELTVFLDSLDECWRHVKELTDILATGFEGDGTSNRLALSLRLACRPGEWHGDLEARLKQLATAMGMKADDAVKAFTLAPLTRDDVEVALERVGLQADEFLQQVADRDLESLAGQPLTLFMLREEFAKGNQLPASAVKLFDDGCLRLCSDLHSQNGGAPLQTTVHRRRDVASQIAAAGLFGNRYLINTDSGTVNGRPDVLEIADIWNDDGTPVSPSEIRETLHTALFSEGQDNLQGWRLMSYPEFLTARRLNSANLPVLALLRILTVEEQSIRRVPPQLAEVARWLAEMDSRLFEALVPADSEILLRCSRVSLNAAQREALVGPFLAGIEANQIEFESSGSSRTKFKHPGLAGQLRAVFQDATRPLRVRLAALDIGRHCCPEELWKDALALYVDRRNPPRLITFAIGILYVAPSDKLPAALLAAAPVDAVIQWAPDERGYYLQVLWPDHLTFQQILPLIQPNNTRVYGAYEVFVESQFIKRLPEKDMLEALRWVNPVRGAQARNLPQSVRNQLFVRAWGRCHEPEIRAEIVGMMLGATGIDEFFGEDNALLTKNNSLDLTSRRAVWLDLIARASTDVLEGLIFQNQYREGGFLSGEDATWFVERAEADPAGRDSWIMLFRHSFERGDSLHWVAAEKLATIDADFAKWLNVRRQSDLHRLGKPMTAPATRTALTPLADRVSALLERFDRGELQGLPRVFLLVAEEERDTHYRTALWEILGWKTLPEPIKARVRAGIVKFLTDYTPPEPNYQESSISSFVLAGVHLLLMEFTFARAKIEALPADLWQKWMPSLIAFQSFVREVPAPAWPPLLAFARTVATQEAVATVRKFAEGGLSSGSLPGLLLSVPLEPDELEEVCFDYLARARASALLPRTVQNFLGPINSGRWRQWLDNAAASTDQAACNRWAAVAAAIRVEEDPSVHFAPTVERMQADQAWGHAVMHHLAHQQHRWHWMSQLPSKALLDFSVWIKKIFPGDPYTDDGGSHTSSQAIYDFRQTLLTTVRSRTDLVDLDAIKRFIAESPADREWFGSILADMRRNYREANSPRFAPGELERFLAHPTYPPIRSEADLFEAVKIALGRYQDLLKGANPPRAMWNKDTVERKVHWWPKEEKEVRDCLLQHLRQELAPFGVTVTSEAESRVREGTSPAEQLDIWIIRPLSVEAQAHVIVEVKGTWNTGLMKDLRGQLVDRYLAHHNAAHGLYVPLHFGCAAWEAPREDRRRESGWSRHTITEIETELQRELAAIDPGIKTVDYLVIDARIGVTRNSAGSC